MSTLIGKAINQRFYTFDAGVKKGVANPERDNYLELAVSPRYKHNLARYLRVIRNIALRESPSNGSSGCNCSRRSCWSRPRARWRRCSSKRSAAKAIPALEAGPEIERSRSAVLLGRGAGLSRQPEAAAPLARGGASDESAFRWHALTALSTHDARRGPRRPERPAARAERRDPLRRVPGAADPQRRRSDDEGRSCSTRSSAITSSPRPASRWSTSPARACRRSSSLATSSG